MNNQTIGFIGLGLMGGAFCQRLLDLRYAVHGYDRVAEKCAAAASHGVVIHSNAAEVAALADIVHVCVMTKADLERAVFGDDGIATATVAGKILIDHSTTPADLTRQFAKQLATQASMDWIDAPVSGGPPAARDGTLAIMAGGDDDVVASAMPVLLQLGQCTHMGPVGAGQVTKMVNQVLVLNNYCVLAEALSLAEAGGVDASKIPAALAQGHAGSNLLQRLYPRMLARDFAPAGFAFQALKDLDMVHDIAAALEVPTPMSSQASSLFRLLNSKGYGDLDGISVLKLYDRNERM